MNLLQMSLFGAGMILVIVILRALALNKLPKKAFLVLWGVVAVRLLIPYSLPSSFSVYSLLGRIAAAAETGQDSSPAVLFTPVAPAYNAMPMAGTAAADTTAPAAVAPWIVVWAVGVWMCAAFFAAVYWKCRREFQASLPVQSEYARHWLGEHRICRTMEIRQSGKILAPLTYGVFRPVILMPKTTDWDDQDTLKYILTHEYVHIRRFDAVTKLVLTIALCVHWFNPAVWLMYVLANRDIELSCDEAVIHKFGEGTKSAYARTLIRMEETRSGWNPLCNNFSKNAIEERIAAIMKIKKTSLAALIAAAALVVGVTATFATSAQADGNTLIGDLAHKSDTADIVKGEAALTSYVDPSDGKTYYSFDGGKTYEPLTDEEFAARFPAHKVEWWTYGEYKAWLENEKVELQDMIGERAWTGSRGEFVWTQEIVDETIAMYEEILENIKNGMLYSKTTDGEDAFCTLSSDAVDLEAVYEQGVLNGLRETQHPAIAQTAVTTAAGSGTAGQGMTFAERFERYASFGIAYEEAEGISGRGNVYYNGQIVSRFSDQTPDGGAFTFSSAEQGDLAVKTVYDSNGRLIGIETVGG